MKNKSNAELMTHANSPDKIIALATCIEKIAQNNKAKITIIIYPLINIYNTKIGDKIQNIICSHSVIPVFSLASSRFF